ncbi:MAG: ABC transporter substrate-binding protein [Burkholderiales bacterium]|nr:ABC transporter substrate-binding protein [Burkholderiales bacterium]
MKRRRAVVAALSAFPLAAAAVPRRIGWLSLGTAAGNEPLRNSVAARLGDRGWLLGRDWVLVARYAQNDLDVLPDAARELLAQQPELVVAVGSSAALELHRLTRTVPVVMWYAITPVQLGLVASLARPGANVTGTTGNQVEMSGKLLETLRLADPRIARVAILRNPETKGITYYSPYAARTATQLGMMLHYFELRRPGDLKLEDLDWVRPDALYIVNDVVTAPLVPALLQYALDRRIATISVDRAFARAGGLLALGPDLDEMETNLVDCIDRILRGASPSTLPVREPSRYWLVLNRRTARAIGLALSNTLLVRAEEVID